MGKKIAIISAVIIALIMVILIGSLIFRAKVNNQIPQKTMPQKNTQTQSMQTQSQISSNEATGLKTYENKTYKFSLQYPLAYQYREYPADGDFEGNVLNIAIGNNVADEDLSIDKDIWIRVFGQIDSQRPLMEPDGMESVSSANATLDGVEAMRYNSENGDVSYVVVNNDLRYELTVPGEADKATKDNFAKMISAFKFIQ